MPTELRLIDWRCALIILLAAKVRLLIIKVIHWPRNLLIRLQMWLISAQWLLNFLRWRSWLGALLLIWLSRRFWLLLLLLWCDFPSRSRRSMHNFTCLSTTFLVLTFPLLLLLFKLFLSFKLPLSFHLLLESLLLPHVLLHPLAFLFLFLCLFGLHLFSQYVLVFLLPFLPEIPLVHCFQVGNLLRHILRALHSNIIRLSYLIIFKAQPRSPHLLLLR